MARLSGERKLSQGDANGEEILLLVWFQVAWARAAHVTQAGQAWCRDNLALSAAGARGLVVRKGGDFDHQQETLFRNETLRRHDGLSKAKSSMLIQIRTGAIGLRDFLFTRGVPEVPTPACECGEGRETAEHLVVWCLAPPLTRRWERTGIRTQRDFYSVLHGINPTTARLARRVLDWLMDSGKLPMYNLARRLELEAAA
ncbi:predicted protein [Chaetomium globosum CBS 148.51]|uniref:Reverse transcriptase zinc-binding domain-containing protein n=1 Tax=Chaetomium globosum (strain ATCC 6205 / CBS 148.51 / DSM 1962 / NBRC 6347 / NRRL 1970) TaxID=306901 RepID=Q2H5K1_CHAGB|nr:uncharacterized protein CHGG_06064 [Chaetomium globosum CBS 148.51]EAQ89445.1 predicted protein [Chaetomium globosum CBS 148.51]